MLKVSNLTIFTEINESKKYLLKDICFSLNSNDSLGIIGKSGDGKSTLCKSLLGIYDSNVYFESGEILIDGEKFQKDFRGKKIILIFQNPNSYLNPLKKVGKQIDEMLIYHFKENKKVAKEKSIKMMEELKIENAEEIYNYYPNELSGGMQQRICLCIALICHPQIIILDECTSYLDTKTKQNIIETIKSLQIKYKFSLIYISHDFREIYSLCNKVAIMRKGQMIEFGPIKEILLNPSHPYTIELLLDYLRYHKNVLPFTCPLMEIEVQQIAKPTYITSSHYVRSWYLDKRALPIKLPPNLKSLKEEIYEIIRN